MTDSDRTAFLAGDRPEDVLAYLSERAVSDPGALKEYGERVADGIVLVLPGDDARGVFQRAAGIDPMAFAKDAMDTAGEVRRDCTGGVCPASRSREGGSDHRARFVFAFAEEQNEAVGGPYAEGDVIHAYVACTCGQRYSDKWVAGEGS
ncbi:MAG: hypothetical protein BRD23_09335 [Halobacteriales archaeon SW_9_67_25]|nr:MAG: hypothetical protein BRD23_09335 [Halobacteriales archaeon SW_9_67_25]